MMDAHKVERLAVGESVVMGPFRFVRTSGPGYMLRVEYREDRWFEPVGQIQLDAVERTLSVQPHPAVQAGKKGA